MYVQVIAEGVQQAFVLGQVRHDPQLDLRVVRRQQLVAFWRDERLTNPPAFSGADRNVLQVRITRRQTPSGRYRLVIRRVDAPGARVDLLRQAVGVGAFQLAHGAVLHQHLGQREILLGQFGKHRFGGRRLALGGLAENRVAEFFVEDRAQLLGRAEVEFLTGDGKCLTLQFDHLLAQLNTLHAEQLGIHQRALTLDTRQHRHQRHLDIGQHADQAGDRLEFSNKVWCRRRVTSASSAA